MALTIDQLEIQIVAESKQATTAIDTLIGRLKEVRSQLNGLGTAGKSAGKGLEKTSNGAKKASTATDKHKNSTDKATKSVKSFTDKLTQQITKYRTLTGAFKSAANMMGSWFNESNEYIETLNLFNVTMGEGATEAYKYAESVQKLVGIDIKDWMQYQGVFKNLTSGFGVASEDANVMSQNLTQLSYDMASFFNTKVETAFDKLSSAMSGQVKGLREFGIDTTVASLQEYALAKGIDAKVRSMTQAEKSLLRYNYIIEKSIIMQGDMARTLVTPANALRILTAQLTQMKRALGNIISVLVTQFIPYVQAMVRVVTDAANALAKFFGFELPKIDYSSLGDGLASGFEDAEESANGVADAAKTIKKQLMGFDELNILSNPANDSSAASGTGGSGALGNMGVSEYDFLKGLDTSKVDELYKKFQKVLTPLKKIWDYLVDYEDTLIAIGSVIAGLSILKGIKNIATALKKLKFVDYFLDGFTFIKAVGGNFFQNFRGGLDMIRQNLTGVQKAMITTFAGVIEFFAIKDSVKALALGCDDVAAKITTIGVVAGGAALAMYTALGPTGLAVAAVVGLAGAIVGVIEANDEMMSELVSEAFYDGVGVKITDLADHFDKLMDSITATNQPILDNKEVIEKAKESIDGAKSSVDYLATSYERGIISTEEFSTKVAENLNTLNENVKVSMDAIYNNIIYALSTSLGDAIEQAGGSVQEYLTIIGKIKNDGENVYNSLVEKQKELKKSFDDGTISFEEYRTGLSEIDEKLSALSGSVSIVEKFSDKIEGLKEAVNWESEEERTNAFKTIHDSSSEAKAAVNEACDEIKRALEAAKLWTTDTESLIYLDELILGNEESRKAQLANVDTAVNTMYDNLQTNLLAKTDEMAQAASEKWDSMGGWAKIWSGATNEAGYVNKAIEKYREDFVKPISKDIQDSMDQLGTDGSVWASEAVDKILENAFDYNRTTEATFVSNYSKALGDSVKTALTNAGKDATEGYKNGVLQTVGGVENAFEQMALEAIKTVKETQDSNSPAKEYIALAKDAVDGYTKGVVDNFSCIEKAFTNGFEKLFNDIKTLVSQKLKDVSNVVNKFSVSGFNNALESITAKAKVVFNRYTWEGFARNVTDALASIKMPTFKNIGLDVTFSTKVSANKEKIYEALGLDGWPSLSWYTYAQGGFPSTGQAFIAREAGPELVGSIGRKTAVANNDQIVAGIESGVYRAMVAANSNNNGGTQTIRIINEIDGDIVGEKVIKYHNGKVMQTGASPLLV